MEQGDLRQSIFSGVNEVALDQQRLVCEIVGGEPYEYYPLGSYVVRAPGVCGGEPTFKYTRINVEDALGRLLMGWTAEQVAQSYTLPVEAVHEAIRLASQALINQSA
jgi:uncharacterized protein (DUF433 family)